MYNNLERKVSKKNCIPIVSEPSACDNFFFDPFLPFYIKTENIDNFNRNSNFIFQDAVDRILWNEPNCETAAFDTVKMLLGGDELPAKVKFEGDAIILKAPIIVLSYKSVFHILVLLVKLKSIHIHWYILKY